MRQHDRSLAAKGFSALVPALLFYQRVFFNRTQPLEVRRSWDCRTSPPYPDRGRPSLSGAVRRQRELTPSITSIPTPCPPYYCAFWQSTVPVEWSCLGSRGDTLVSVLVHCPSRYTSRPLGFPGGTPWPWTPLWGGLLQPGRGPRDLDR